MKVMWIVFAAGALASAFLLSGLGQGLLVIMMISFIGLPLAVPLMFVPLLTATYGLFLVTYTVLMLVPFMRRTNRAIPTVIALALVGGTLTYLPIHLNKEIKPEPARAVASDMPLSDKRAPGVIAGFDTRQDDCTNLCASLLLTVPEAKLVLGEFDASGDSGRVSARVPEGAHTWTLAEGGLGQCPHPHTQASDRVRIALAEAELQGRCLTKVPSPEQVDLMITDTKPAADAPGQFHSDDRKEMFLRDGDSLHLAYRRTTGERHLYTVPLLFYSSDGYGLDLGLSLGPKRTEVSLESPVAARGHIELLERALPGAAALSNLAAPSGLSQKERKALIQREKEVRQRLIQTRHDAALAALTSGDPERLAEGTAAAQRYFGVKSRRGLTDDDLPLLEALLTAPVDPGRDVFPALRHSSPAIKHLAVNTVIDQIIATGDAPFPSNNSAIRKRERSAKWLSGYLEIDRLAQDLDRIDRLVQTRRGRWFAGEIMHLRGALGPGQAPALLRFLDARRADGEREKGYETIYKGLCLMGPDGVPFLDDVKKREVASKSANSIRASKFVRYLVPMELDDDAIGQHFRVGELKTEKERSRVAAALEKARGLFESRMSRLKDSDHEYPRHQLCK